MRQLFEMDLKNYAPDAERFVRPSVRAVIVRDGRIAMVHSLLYNYYKFPGGGIEPGETHRDCLIRETLEEAGLSVLPESIQAYGAVRRVEKLDENTAFEQDNYYYLCQADRDIRLQRLDAYEAEERFTLEFVEPETAIHTNRLPDHGPKNRNMLEREAKVLECLQRDGIL